MTGPAAPGAPLRIMIVTRSSVNDPFGEPRVLDGAHRLRRGSHYFLSMERAYHKKAGRNFVIYRAERNIK